MSNSPTRAGGRTQVWADLARSDASRTAILGRGARPVAADLLRSVLSDASPALPADEASWNATGVSRLLGGRETRRRTSLGITGPVSPSDASVVEVVAHARPTPTATRRCVNSSMPWTISALFDSEPSARSRRARLTWLLTHDRRLMPAARGGHARLRPASISGAPLAMPIGLIP